MTFNPDLILAFGAAFTGLLLTIRIQFCEICDAAQCNGASIPDSDAAREEAFLMHLCYDASQIGGRHEKACIGQTKDCFTCNDDACRND